MLPPKEEGEAGHLYPENITPTTKKSIQNLEIGFSSSKEESLKCLQKPEQLDEAEEKEIKDSDFEQCSSSSSSSSQPDSPVEDDEEACRTSLIILDSEFDSDSKLETDMEKEKDNFEPIIERSLEIKYEESTLGIGTILQQLENVKTPEPSDMNNSIVRASFVDFSVDDDDGNEIRSQHSQGQPLEEESGEDEDAKEFSLSLNPDLPKIRAQQIQNWLEFEKEQEKYDSLNNNEMTGHGEMGHFSSEEINNLIKGGEFELDSLSEQTGDHTLTDADGLQRRVRFLTDPYGRILISVFLTKLVQFILSILKLATAGYLDFTPSSNSNNTLDDCPPAAKPTIPTIADANNSDNNLRHDLPCHFNETDDDHITKNHSGEEGEEEHVIQVVQHANNPEGGPTTNNPFASEIGESQDENFESQPNEAKIIESTLELNNTEEISLDPEPGAQYHGDKKDEEVKDVLNEEEQDQQAEVGEGEELLEDSNPQQSHPAQVVEEIKKVISVDPRLNNFDDCEDTGSDSETLSTSSCSSMIEVIPKEKSATGEIEFIKNDDGSDDNNNELKTDVIYLKEDPDTNTNQSITCYEFQPENETNTDVIVKQPDTEKDIPEEKSQNSENVILSSNDVKSGTLTSGEVATLLESKPTEETPINLLKFNPILESESQIELQVVNNEHPIVEQQNISSNNQQSAGLTDGIQYITETDVDPLSEYGNDPEQQLVSLCIEEEPISAVALTIAKWESFSKKQQQQAESGERVNTAVKGMGKLILPSYTNNNNIGTGTNTGTTTSPVVVQHTCNNGKPVPISSQIPIKTVSTNGNVPTAPSTPAFNNNSTNNNNNNILNNKTAPGWNSWGNNVKTNEKPMTDDEEAIYAQPNSQAGSISTSLSNPSAILKGYPKPNSRGEIINWFKEGEIHRSGILLSYGQTNHHSPVAQVTSPVIVSWFFGLITRQQAEEFLHGQPTGTFLVRISTRIWGYTLSYQSNNKTKHFLISAINPAVPATLSAGAEANGGHNPSTPTPTGKQQLLFPFSPGGRYAFIGTNMTPYTTLTSLIRHHSHAPITKAGGEKLLTPCSGGPKIAGIEYVFK